MNALMVIHYPVFGGPHNQALRLAGPLEQFGWHTIVLLPDDPGNNAAGRLRNAGLEVITVPLGRLRASPNPRRQVRYAFNFGADVRSIQEIIRTREIELVVLAGHVNVQGSIAARREQVPVIWQVLDTRTPSVLDEFFLRLSRRLADVIMTTGRKVAERHQKRLGEAQHVVPFYPPVDCSEFTPRQDLRDEVRREWGIDHDAPVLGTVSNINPQKGIDQLILALVHTRHREPAARLVIVGSEHDTHRKYATALRAEMMRWGLVEGTDVVFTGSRSDVHRQVQGFDVFVMGSVPNSEGVPTVVLEAMSAGLPVVATDVGGVSEVVENGVTGFVVPPLQPAVLADAALEILNDRELLRQMSAEARARAVQRFDIGVCIRTHLEAFDAALPGARGNLIERPRAA